MEKEELLMVNRFQELANKALYRSLCFYTDFLNLNELTLFFEKAASVIFPVSYELWGGFETAERKMLCFYTEESYEKPDFPIAMLKIEPLQEKFSDALSHRDYLGAILNLGIEREKTGDILITDKSALLFCHKAISSYIEGNLERIRHTSVRVTPYSQTDIAYAPQLTPVAGTVSSVRLDAVLSVAFQSSRSSLVGLIEGKKVFVNSRLTESNSYVLKENDLVSVRGLGRFIFKGIEKQTKKGRYFVTLLKY